MPGSFFLDSPVPPKLDLVGAKSQLLQVPQTPSASSSLYRSISYSRKRPRYGSDKRCQSAHHSDFGAVPATPDSHLADDFRSWSGKRETPTEFDYRLSRYRENNPPPTIDDSFDSHAPIEASGNSRKRSRRESLFSTLHGSEGNIPSHPASVSWGRSVINIVGKVWDFCWSGAFGGFYAGGGQGYRMDPGSSSQVDDTPYQPDSVEKDDIFTTNTNQHNRTPIPGQFPEDDIQRNWVMVADDTDVFVDAVGPSSPSRRLPRKNANQFYAQRRRTMMSQPAKRAYMPSTPTRAHPMSPKTPQSPSSAETQRHVARMRRMERQEDASLRRLNNQLETMIKEGQAALGTTVEVNDLEMED